MTTPVAIVFFNRIEPLKRLVARLADVRPPKVYLIADGARSDRLGEAEKVAACRAFMRTLPWPCKVEVNFASENLGCRKRVTSGLDWVFEHEERAIVLEDDCIPEVEFFPWVERMLKRYAKDERVLSVGGTNLRPQVCDPSVDCVFTKYAMIWGWATWRRAWRMNDGNLERFPMMCAEHGFKKWLGKWRAEWYWRYLLTHVKSSWGYRWSFTHFAHQAFCVVPPVNLVKNIGMTDVDATHTRGNPYELPSVTHGWESNGKKIPAVASSRGLDDWIEDCFYSRSFVSRIVWFVRRFRRIGI